MQWLVFSLMNERVKMEIFWIYVIGIFVTD